MEITLPFKLGQEVYWYIKDRDEETMRMQFMGFSQYLSSELELQFRYTGLTDNLRNYSCRLPLSTVLNEFRTNI